MAKINVTNNGRACEVVPTANGFDLVAEGAGNGRFLEVWMVEGGFVLRKPGSLTSGIGLELDENGRAVFHDA